MLARLCRALQMRVGISKKRKRKAMSEEKTYKQMREEFTKKFYGEISPEIQKYDKERVSKLKTSLCISTILVLIGILFGILKFNARTYTTSDGKIIVDNRVIVNYNAGNFSLQLREDPL